MEQVNYALCVCPELIANQFHCVTLSSSVWREQERIISLASSLYSYESLASPVSARLMCIYLGLSPMKHGGA